MIQRPSWFLDNIKQKPSLWAEKSKTDVSLEKWCTAERGDRKSNNFHETTMQPKIATNLNLQYP